MLLTNKSVDIARGERQKLNSFWYPQLNTSGMYVHLSENIEVRQPLNTYTEPAKEFAQSVLPDDQFITSILDQVGNFTLSVPIVKRNLTTVDLNLTWPVFTGGKRIYASRIGNRMVDLAEVEQTETGAVLQMELVQAYYALRLAEKVVEVREQTFQSLQQHYNHALKLEANGMITKTERLFAEVNCQEAKREWEAAKKDRDVAHQALCSLLDLRDEKEIVPVTPLFITADLPGLLYFHNLLSTTNYTLNKLRLEESIADNQLRISQSAYIPTIAFIGKHTLYAHNLPSNLLPRTLIGIGFTWNLFDGLNREADVRMAQLTKKTLALGMKKVENEQGVLIQKLYTELQKSQEEVVTLQTTITMSEELLRIRRKSFDEGMATSTEVVDAEVLLSQVKIAMLLAFFEFDVSLASLCSVCGVPEMFWKFISTQSETSYMSMVNNK